MTINIYNWEEPLQNKPEDSLVAYGFTCKWIAMTLISDSHQALDM